MISQTSEYALRAVVHLAQNPSGPASAQEISRATKVPVGYLQKILRMLSREGILVAQRGVGGGFSLAKLASSISVLDILRATDTEISRIEHCPLGIKGHMRLCALHTLLDQEIARMEQRFASTSIADLLQDVDGIRPLCETSQRVALTSGVSSNPNSREAK